VLWGSGFLSHPIFGLTTKARACKGGGPRGSLGVTSHAPESVRKCEGTSHSKGAPTLGVGVLVLKFLESNCRGQNLID